MKTRLLQCLDKVRLFVQIFVVVIILVFGLNRVTDRTLGILLSTAFKIRYKEALTKVYTAAHITASKYLSFLTKEETNCKPFCFELHPW